MKVLKLFTLLTLLIGLWVVSSKPVSAKTNCYQEYAACYGDAQTARDNCYYMCSGIIACEAVCDGRYYDATATCDSDYESCINP